MAEISLDLARRIRREATNLGFAAIGFAAPHEQSLAMQRLQSMIDEHRHGEMNYMTEHLDERSNPALLLPTVQTIVTAALSYNYPLPRRDGIPKISRYALIDDYHTVMKSQLEKLAEIIEQQVGETIRWKIAVDSVPMLEKSWAEQAGIGKVGKNTLLKIPSAGSFLFLGELLIDKEIRTSPLPLPNYCGSCNACIEHCPTGALLAPGKLDASRCISYLTTELKRDFTPNEATMLGDWLFGCDVCQDICPYNKQANITAHPAFTPRQELLNLSTDEILNLTKSGFRKLFWGTPIFRTGLRRLKRNARAVEENLKRKRRNDV